MTGHQCACVRGCTRARRHLTDCMEADCSGCEPRTADHGVLCWPCHRRLELMLVDAPVVHDWLGANMPNGVSAARPHQDWERKGGEEGSPAPLKVAVLDHRWLLSDRLSTWTETVCENLHLSGPDTAVIDRTAEFLLQMLPRIEDHWWVLEMFDELAETTSDAHALAPWRPELRRLDGIPCPECHWCALVIYGGDVDATCQECGTMVPEKWYPIWTQIAVERWGDTA